MAKGALVEQKSRTKFLPWPGFEPRNSRLADKHASHSRRAFPLNLSVKKCVTKWEKSDTRLSETSIEIATIDHLCKNVRGRRPPPPLHVRQCLYVCMKRIVYRASALVRRWHSWSSTTLSAGTLLPHCCY